MKYWLTEPAKEDLLDIWEYSAQQWNPTQADHYIDALTARMAWLTENTALWKPRPDIEPGIYSYPEQSHVIIFWERRETLEILRVLHGRMDPNRRL
jgi:toxin ParE1/3/4